MDDQLTEEEREAALTSSSEEDHRGSPAPEGPARLGQGMNSSMGFFYKFIFTPSWIVLFGTGAYIAFIRKGNIEVVFMWLVGTSLLYLFCGRLKRVCFSPSVKMLYVSNFFKMIEIPFDDIVKISGSLMLRPELVFIRLKRDTAFGRRIYFMPKFRFLGGYSEHPIAEELRKNILGKTTNKEA